MRAGSSEAFCVHCSISIQFLCLIMTAMSRDNVYLSFHFCNPTWETFSSATCVCHFCLSFLWLKVQLIPPTCRCLLWAMSLTAAGPGASWDPHCNLWTELYTPNAQHLEWINDPQMGMTYVCRLCHKNADGRHLNSVAHRKKTAWVLLNPTVVTPAAGRRVPTPPRPPQCAPPGLDQ